jgi:hypothetical protein
VFAHGVRGVLVRLYQSQIVFRRRARERGRRGAQVSDLSRPERVRIDD